MSFEIGKGGIASVDFNISLDCNSTIVKMIQPYENKGEFHQEKDRIASIFGATQFLNNSMLVSHGNYSKKTITKLKRAVDALMERSIIDLQRHNEIIQKLEEMVAQVKIESERETKQFESLLSDFKKNVESLYKVFSRSSKLKVDDSINQLDYLIDEVCYYHGNPMKVGSRWLFLFLSEGALEKLIKSLNTEEDNELKERIEALHLGVTSFLQKYESEIHVVIEKTITEDAPWFQQLYKNYILMVTTGKSPSEDCYGPIPNMNLGTYRLYLPTRFVK